MISSENKKDILKQNLFLSSDNLTVLAEKMPAECAEIITTDSLGKDPQSLLELLNSISQKFGQLAKELDEPFKIAVVGSQGTGKSTVVNLLLGEALMPSTLDENEGAVIRLAYPEDESLENQAVFELADKSKKIMSITEALKIIDTAKRNRNDDEFVKSIAFVTFYIQHEQLKEIELINTPGMNVLTDDFYPKVQHLFVEADIIIWVNAREMILDEFNFWLIQKIHADNHRIIGMITFPDKLYGMDQDTGVTDVVNQFMNKVEDKKLMRTDGEVALFIFNGRFAQIAKSHNKKAKFIIDTCDISEDEAKLRMLYNYMHHNFAYSNNLENVKVLQEHRLYGISDSQLKSTYEQNFDLNNFYDYCVNERFCTVDEESESALYTEKGRALMGEASQFAPFQRFADDHLKTKSLGEKYESVKERLMGILSTTDGADTSKARLVQLKNMFELKQSELGKEEQQRGEDFNKVLHHLKLQYNDWWSSQIGFQSVKYTDELLELVFERFEDEINGFDFFKEIISTLTPDMFKSGKDSPISKKISDIISESVEKVFPIRIEILSKEAETQIELILIQMKKDFLSEKNEINADGPALNFHINNKIDLTLIMKAVGEILKKIRGPLLKEIIKKIVKKDLRKGKNNVFKKMVVKPMVKAVRNMLKKFGIEFAKKNAKKAATKGWLGPLGWVLLAWDVLSTINDFHNMYKEMKEKITEQLKDDPSFKEGFSSEAKNVYNGIHDYVKEQLIKAFTDDTQDLSFIINGLAVCDDAIDELNNIEQKIGEN